MAIQILEIEQNTDEWLKAREGKVSGSIADVLLTRGLDAALQENYKHFKGNYYTQRGHILEVECIEVYEGIHGVKVERPGMVINSNFHNASCSPDGIDGQYLIEVKCFNEKRHAEIVSVNSIPMKIMAQLQFNMMICELKESKLLLYNPDCDKPEDCYRELRVRANPRIQGNLKIKLKG